MGNDGQLPFLDVITKRTNDGSIGHAVYINQRTPIDLLLHIPITDLHKNSVLNTLISKAIRISDEKKSCTDEKVHLKSTLKSNGYSMSEVNKAFKRQIYRNETQPNSKSANPVLMQQTTNEMAKKAILPYVRRATDVIARILKKEIKTIFKLANKV